MNWSRILTIALACLGVATADILSPTRADVAFAHFQEFLTLRGLEAVESSPPPQLPLGKRSESAPARKQNDVNWSVPFLPKGPSGWVYALDVRGNEVVAGGRLIGADDGLASMVALWDGTQWRPLGRGTPSGGRVYDLDRDAEGRIYAAGWFDSIGTKACNGVARWEGGDWQCMELHDEFDPGVEALTLVGEQVFAGTGHGVFRWNGSEWDSLSPGIRGAITRMGNSGGRLWVAGRFTVGGDTTLRNLVVRNGDKWAGFGSGPGPIRDFAVLGEEIVAIESYSKSDRTDSQAVVRWSGSMWAGVEALPLGTGYFALGGDSLELRLLGWDARKSILQLGQWDGRRFQLQRSDAFVGSVSEMRLSTGKAYLGGSFAGVGDVRADNVVTLQGGQWSGLSKTSNPGLSYSVECMASNGSELFLGGRFLRFAGNQPVSGIAKWDGSKWDALGGGFKVPSNAVNFLDLNVNAIAPAGNQVYAGGRFDSSQSGPALNIARWDGMAWHPLGSGFPGVVNDIVSGDSGIFAGGRTDTLALGQGTSPIAGQAVAFWDGQAWRKVGLGLQGEVKKLIHFENDLYAAGKLRRTGEDSVYGILKWNGERWLTLGSGLSRQYDSAFALTFYSGKLYVLGRKSGGTASECLLTSLNAQGLIFQEEITNGIALASDNEFLYLLLLGSSQEISALQGADLGRWSASQGWQALNSDIAGTYYVLHGAIATLVPSMTVHGSHLYVSGRFTEPINGVPVQYLARWTRSGAIGTRGLGRQAQDGGQRPRIFLTGILDRDIHGGWEVFDLRGRTLPVLDVGAGARGGLGAQGPRILKPISSSVAK